MKKFTMTKAEAEAHQRRHGFMPVTANDLLPTIETTSKRKPRMNKTETEFSYILETQKRQGEISEWMFEGMTLSWGTDPDTGKPMRYTPDFTVVKIIPIECESCGKVHTRLQTYLRFIEVKGQHIRSRDLVRFKGCKAWWPQFAFELHQRDKNGRWTRLL